MEAVRATKTTAVRIGLTTISTKVCFRPFRLLLTDQSWEKENTDSSASYGFRRWQVKVAGSGPLAFAPQALQHTHGSKRIFLERRIRPIDACPARVPEFRTPPEVALLA